MKSLVLKLVTLLLLVSCNNVFQSKSNNFAEALSEHSGVRYEIVKKNTLIGDYVVLQNMETGEFVAYNLANYEKNMSMNQFLSSLNAGDIQEDLDSFNVQRWEWRQIGTYQRRESDWRWEWDPVLERNVYVEYVYYVDEPIYGEVLVTYTYYTNEDHSMTFSLNDQVKDLEKIAGLTQKGEVDALSTAMTKDFGLSEERSEKIARTLVAFQKIQNQRSLTSSDYDSLLNETLGTDFETFLKVKSGEESSESLIEIAAEINQVSPEHMSQIMESFL